tara:strand:- start:1022 stop:1426 length:405 start_codon:yes stop_codon:yes gene_type:complete
MALVGGGGSPNVSGGASPASTGTSLNTIGDFAYAYSGNVTVASGGTTMLSFTTGQYLFKGTLQVLSTDASGEDCDMTFTLNGESAMAQKFSNTGNGPAGIYPIDVLIPSDSIVNISIAGDGRVYSVGLVGRIYQ